MKSLLLMIAMCIFTTSCASQPQKSSNESESEKVITITARMFSYAPSEIHLKTGIPVTLELVSKDRLHGFNIPVLNIRTDIPANQTKRIKIIPEKAGRYMFFCDIFCGAHHDEMSGIIIVSD